MGSVGSLGRFFGFLVKVFLVTTFFILFWLHFGRQGSTYRVVATTWFLATQLYHQVARSRWAGFTVTKESQQPIRNVPKRSP